MKLTQFFSRVIFVLFHVLFLVVPLVFTSVNDELFEFNKMLAVYAIVILMGGAYIGKCIVDKKIHWRQTPLDIPIILFVGSQIISTVFSINVHTSLFGYYTRFNGGLLSLLSYIFLYYMFATFVRPAQIRSYITSLLTGGVLAAIYALPEHFGHSPSCLLFTGKFDVACWVQDVQTRVFGTFGQPNWLAAYLGLLLPLAIVNVKHVRTQIKLMEDDSLSTIRNFLVRLMVVILFLLVLFYTGSRSGIVGVGVGFFLLMIATISFVVFAKAKGLTSQYHPIFREYAIMLGVSLLTLGIITFAVANPIRDKVLEILPKTSGQKTIHVSAPTGTTTSNTQLEVGGSESGEIRSVVWRGALLVWRRYPLFGSGVETFAYSYYKDRLKEHNLLSEWDFLYNKAHNEFLNYLATTGLVGLLTYLLLLTGMIVVPCAYIGKLLAHRFKTEEDASQALHHAFVLISISSGIAILSISNFFGFSTVMVSALMFVLSGFTVVIGQTQVRVEKNKHEEESISSEITASQWLTLGATFFFCAIFLFYVWRLWSADVAYARGKQYNNAGQYEGAFGSLRQATEMIPEEPVYHDEYSSNLAQLAVSFAKQKDATKASEFASEALRESDTTINLNSVHTNFWKTRVKVYLTLSQLDPHFYAKAEEALNKAHELSPTDPKIVYYLALLSESKGDSAGELSKLLVAIDLKPNYEEARNALAKYYEAKKEPQKALEQYEYMIKFINPNNSLAKERIASLSAQQK